MQWWAAISLLLATPILAADTPNVQRNPPTVYKSACALAESMASKLGYRSQVPHERALQTCQTLAPTMNPTDHADFMRCCMARLESGPPPDSRRRAPAARPASPSKPS
jgi:hypothetical protein